MHRKGTLGMLIGIMIATIIILTVTGPLKAAVVDPLLYDVTKTTTYEDFSELSLTIQNLLTKSSQSVMNDNILFQLEKDYTILAFPRDDKQVFCGYSYINKPEECGENACLCLYRGELKDEKPGEDKNEKMRVANCAVFGNAELLSLYKQVPNTAYISIQRTYGYPTCTRDSRNIIYSEQVDGENVDFRIPAFSGMKIDEETDLQTSMDTINLLIFVRKDDDYNKVFININDDENKELYKKMNTCPAESYSECVGKHYDSVFIELVDNEEEKFACKFNENANSCLKQKIGECPQGSIFMDCACGDTAYDSGFCVNDEYFANDIPTNYCLQSKVGGCEEYKGEYNAKPYACIFDICSVGINGCYWDSSFDIPLIGGIKANSCEECPSQCDCDDLYDKEWVKEENPCGCDC